ELPSLAALAQVISLRAASMPESTPLWILVCFSQLPLILLLPENEPCTFLVALNILAVLRVDKF
ncbi:hypothetical protein, partial [Desulfovibrio desulfuricans]|uniref:hypothetical protein n=1 Tax=Desulfovibrio desulfuricans TaxID=876 RepID=UPI002B21F350